MPKSLSSDLRVRVVAAISGGLSRRQAAQRFNVSPSSAIRWSRLANERGDINPRPRGGVSRSRHTEAHGALILRIVDEEADLTLDEIRARLATHGAVVSYGALWRFFRRHGITHKKRPPMPQSGTGRTS